MPRKQRVPATCTECGNQFRARVDDVKRGWGTTCSRVCGMHAARKFCQASSPERKAAQIRASGLINSRIRRGAMARPGHCSNCGKEGRVDAHHEDYGKPSEVEWLCRSCHMKRHFGRELLRA